ncbi:phage tail tube protein [Streptomyces sp. DH37]|uniref:phage tail tube protein n=1 Tax=Streptomyces sp. DH37 TaxID=3040122 RepID=UPI002441788A|nr:phage tail tube protein [Streptomyces sp. DH37]MDG9705544.1 phage tail tube protein [Streptomyces sp. DH37]
MPGIDAFGIALQRSDMVEASPTFTAIGNVTSVSGPEIERETYDVTSHDSPDKWREFVGGLVDGGEVTLEINYDPSQHDTLIDDFADTEPRDYKLVFPQSLGTWDLTLLLTGFSPEAPVDDKLTAELTFKVTGKPTITPGA